MSTPSSTVGIIANPWAGKDVRRLHARSGHGADSAKIGIVQRAAVGAIAGGARRVLIAADVSRIGQQALDDPVVARTAADYGANLELVEGPDTGSSLDTRRAAASMHDAGAAVLIALGGDGTSRDIAIGAPDAALIALSTGTNNVFPRMLEATSAGWAAGLVAQAPERCKGSITRAKRIVATLSSDDDERNGLEIIALVDLALIGVAQIGARAVVDPASVKAVVAVIAEPASTGLSAIAARLHPIRRSEPGAVAVVLGAGGRRLRVPLVPGSIADLCVESVQRLGPADSTELAGPGTLACDGERDLVLRATETVRVAHDHLGPRLVDVDHVLTQAALDHRFDHDSASSTNRPEILPHGN